MFIFPRHHNTLRHLGMLAQNGFNFPRFDAIATNLYLMIDAPKEVEVAAGPGGVLLKIETKDSQQALVNVFAYFNERDVVVTSVRILEPNLESVFLHLTGKKLWKRKK